MGLTKADRRRINRENAQHSTGPKSEAGKARASMNAVTHGLRIESLALPLTGEDATTLRDRLREWDDCYRPDTPAERELLEMAVTASAQRRRALAFQAVTLAENITHAQLRWDQQRDQQVETFKALLKPEPAEAVAGLMQTAHGCRWMIARWEDLEELLEKDGTWYGDDRDLAIQLQGLKA